ncbi:NUDIX hydrolase [Bowmanella denitrificans]|uniref:NUDIX hydrolase n=1 Tax=Bowmanella denitrificans TaxID=366582 RepID=UPI0031D5E4A5
MPSTIRLIWAPARLNTNAALRIKLLVACTLSLMACTPERPADPMCRVKEQTKEATPGNAACLIKIDKWLVTIGHRHSGKLDLPGGLRSGQESAQCTAHRETWEETGFNVEVGRFLGANENGFRIYACQLQGNFGHDFKTFPVPEWATTEVSSIQLTDPFEIQIQQWRFEEELLLIRRLFNQAD